MCRTPGTSIVVVMLATWVSMAQAAIPTSYPTGPGPAKAEMSGGQLVYTYESNGDRIPDFSSAGYGSGGVPIPDVPVVLTISPISGDDTTNIQNAINQVASMPMQGNGFRGALLLNPGVYEISGTLEINASGVVVRGSGDDPSGTVLRRVAGGSDDLIFARELPKTLPQEISGTRRDITNSYVPVGATWVTLENTSGYSVGDEIIIQRVSTPEWVEEMNETGQWDSNDAGIRWYRVVTEVDGNRIRFDAPVFQALEAEWGQHYVFKYSWPTRLQNVGIEDIRGESTVNPNELGNTTGDLFMFYHVWNGWIRRCTNDKMTGHTIKLDACQFITVEDILSYHNPLTAGHSGASTQIFTGDYMDSIYFHRISAYSAGFEFTAGKQASGPVVFSESEVPEGFAASGPHMQMNMGMLYDDLTMDHGISFQKQSKGWNGGNGMAWNIYTAQAFNFERPPTMHLWIHGGFAESGINSSQEGDDPETYMYGTFITPTSLYRQQLYDRVGQTQAIAAIGLPGGSQPPGSEEDVYQAEDYTSQSGCSFSSGIAGYTGTGFMDYGGNGTWVEWSNVNVDTAGNYDLVFRYGNGSGGDRQCAIVVNGNTAGNVAFGPTGSWSTWGDTAVFTVTLNVGDNTIRVLANTSSGGSNLDKMSLSGGPVSGGTFYEAEDFSNQSGTAVSSGITGYTGDGFVDYGGNGTWIEWDFVDPGSAGNYDLVFRYGNGSGGNRQSAIIVNGNTIGNVDFVPTGSWNTWGLSSAFTVALNSGSNTIRVLANTSSGGPNLDNMELFEVSGTSGGTFEAEDLTISASSGDSNSINSEGGASNGAYLMYNSNAVNDFVTLTLLDIAPGSYDVTIGYKQYTSRGIVQVQVGPAGGSLGNLGSPIDMYGGSAFLETSIGVWTIGSTGDKSVNFLVTGKNAGSSDYKAAIDYITLTPQ